MKTTLELPDDLIREIKLRAVREDKKLKDLVAELLRRGMAQEEQKGGRAIRHRVKLPLIHTAHPASPEQEVTPEVIAQILIDQEVEWALGRE